MLLWFAGLSFAGAWLAFRSPALDYRLVMLGSVLPLLDSVMGGSGSWVLHTLVASVAMLVVVMVATSGRRLARRRWLGLAIGMFLHLVLDGVWTRADAFWWPFLGGELGAGLPEAERAVVLAVAMELVGVVALGWCAVRFGLVDRGRRRRFIRAGQLDRALARDTGGASC